MSVKNPMPCCRPWAGNRSNTAIAQPPRRGETPWRGIDRRRFGGHRKGRGSFEVSRRHGCHRLDIPRSRLVSCPPPAEGDKETVGARERRIQDGVASAFEALDAVGLPAIIRPSFTLGGQGGGITYNQEFDTIVRNGLRLCRWEKS